MSLSTAPRTLPPPGAGLPAKVVPIPPNQTLYIRNLPSAKIRKDDLRSALYLLFTTYGTVLDVVALKTQKMRGQAHIVFRDVQAATQAMRSLDGVSFLGLEMKIAYAKSRSNVLARLDGTSYEAPKAALAVEVTELQQSIFNAPAPGAVVAAQSKPPKLEAAATDGANGAPANIGLAGPAAIRGQKRTRDEGSGSESDSDVAMEEDSDDE